MNVMEVLEAVCCLAAADSDVTVEELQLLSALAGRVGIERKRFETLMEKAGSDASFREQQIGAVSGDIEGAMDKLMDCVSGRIAQRGPRRDAAVACRDETPDKPGAVRRAACRRPEHRLA